MTDTFTATKPGNQIQSNAGENICPKCNGTGRFEFAPCPKCDGSGKITEGIRDA